jgi:hypothetical protein
VKIGAENKKAMLWMIALLGVALLVVIYDFANFGTSSAAPPAASTSTAAQKKTTQVSDNALDPRFRTDILADSQNKKYETGRNIFRMEELPIPKMEGNGRAALAPMGPEFPPTPTPTPTPPPIPLKFYGFASKANEPKRVFLADADEVFVAKQGDIVERKYKVVQINNANVIIEYLLYNNRQPIPLTAR